MMRLGLVGRCAVFLVAASCFAIGQARENVLYNFGASPNDGSIPNGGLIFDSAGNLYGTTQRGGANSGGIAFELTPGPNDTWTETIIYNFCSQPNCADGGVPMAGLIFDKIGNLYGTTLAGGAYSGGTCNEGGCGTTFELSPPSMNGEPWTEKVLWNFQGNLKGDGAGPEGKLVWDAVGNLYGTTSYGISSFSLGSVFELSPTAEGSWNETILYAFCVNGPPCADGALPLAGVSFDRSGNLYGTTAGGAFQDKWGTVYKLSPQQNGTWG